MKKKPYIIAFFFFLIDLISKQIIMHYMQVGKSIELIPNFFYITYAKNRGAAWSILSDKRMLLLIITMIVLYLIYKTINKENLNKFENISYGLIIGGILGNFFDRLAYSEVTDFLDFKIFNYDYPVFNLADTFIVIGIILLIIYSIRKDYYERNQNRGK